MAVSEERIESQSKKKPHYWLIYVAALLGGLLLLADAVDYGPAVKLTARLGIGLIYTALVFLAVGSRPSAWIGAVMLWLAIALTFLL